MRPIIAALVLVGAGAGTIMHAGTPLLVPVRVETNGQFYLQLVGDLGSNYAVEASMDITNWLFLTAGKATNGSLMVVDDRAVNYSHRFYRGRSARRDEIPNPFNAVTGLDTGLVARATIPVDGGFLSLTNPDGTRFTLSVPTNALLSPEEISMTLVTNMTDAGGLPLPGNEGRRVVQLGPEGLRLLEPATLTIESSAPLTTNEVVGFAYEGSGAELHPYPQDITGQTITFQVLNFSGYGAGQADSPDLSGYTPTSVEDRSMQALAQLLIDARRNGTQPDLNKAQTILSDWFNDSIKASVTDAESNEAVLDEAATEFFRWRAHAAVLGIEAALQDKVDYGLKALAKGVNNAVNLAHARCVQNNDATELRNILRRARMGSVLGLVPYGFDDIGALDKAYKCARFELDMESEILDDLGHGVLITKVRALVPIMNLGALNQYNGEGPLTYVNVEYPPSPPPPNGSCTTPVASPTGSTEKVLFMTINWNFNITKFFRPMSPKVFMTIDPGDPLEHVHYSCTANGVTFPINLFDQPAGAWKGAFMALHANELNQTLGGFVIQDWAFIGSSIFATKPYQRTVGLFTETTTFDLKHTPEP